MGIVNSSSSSGAAGISAGQTIVPFKNVAETIDEGDFVTLDTNTGSIQRANAIDATLFGQNAPGIAAAVSLNSWGHPFSANVHKNPDGTLLYVEGSTHASVIGGAQPQLIKVSADGSAILKTINLPAVTSGNPSLVPLSGNRIAYIQYTSTSSVTVTVYDCNTLDLLQTATPAFTGGATNPFASNGDAIEAGNGEIVLVWGYQTTRHYAVLNANLTVKTQPTSLGSQQSSFSIIQRLRLSSGRVIMAATWNDGSGTINAIFHFDQAGTYVNTHTVGGTNNQFMHCAHVDIWNDRQYRHIVEVSGTAVAYVYNDTGGRYFRKLNLVTGTTVFNTSLGDNNHVVSWCIKDGFAYVLSLHNTGNPMPLKAATFNLTTDTVSRALSTLANITSSYGLAFTAAFLRSDEWWILGTASSHILGGDLHWMGLTIAAGAISVKFSRTSIASMGAIQEMQVTGDEVIVLYGGNADGSTYVNLNAMRINLLTGAVIGSSFQLRTHASGQAPVGGMNWTPETRMLFRHSNETAMLFGYGAGTANNVLTRAYFKPITSILLGVANLAAAAGQAETILSGWANVSDRYNKFQKTIDHTAQNGNKAKTYGAAAYLSGTF